MSSDDWISECKLLSAKGVTLAAGLIESELNAAESAHGFRFPPDLRSFLSRTLPVGRGFPNWRAPASRELLDWWEMVFERIAFDIRNDAFWFTSWGAKPVNVDDAIAVARKHIDSAPRLIPIFSHRAIPAEPSLAGNPVFSPYSSDVIYYGADLRHYFACEFDGLDHQTATSGDLRRIPFWSDLVDSAS